MCGMKREYGNVERDTSKATTVGGEIGGEQKLIRDEGLLATGGRRWNSGAVVFTHSAR